MRLRLLVLLLVLLPLQQSWAAMGPYCGDAQMAAVLCCDHAIPVAEAAMSGQSGTEALPVTSQAADEADCGTCHANGTAALFAFSTLHLPALRANTADGQRTKPRPVPAQRPERPQWPALV